MLFFLAKIFSERQHADEMLEGKLFVQRLCQFKKLEDSAGRGDRDEGSVLLPSDNAELTFSFAADGEQAERIVIRGEELAAPVEIRPKWFDHVHVYCMYAAHSGTIQFISEENIEAVRRQFELPRRYQDLGSHAVVVTDVKKFLERVQGAAAERGFGMRRGIVDYYDDAAGSPRLSTGLDTIFAKRRQFDWQREYRIEIDTSQIGCDPITLEIGPIDDIAWYAPTAEFNSMISVQLPQGDL